MNHERLRLFLAIVDSGSMAAASRRVHLSQPAFSRSIKLLEEEIGAALFGRQSRNLVLTNAGRVLEVRGRELLERASAVTASTASPRSSCHTCWHPCGRAFQGWRSAS